MIAAQAICPALREIVPVRMDSANVMVNVLIWQMIPIIVATVIMHVLPVKNVTDQACVKFPAYQGKLFVTENV